MPEKKNAATQAETQPETEPKNLPDPEEARPETEKAASDAAMDAEAKKWGPVYGKEPKVRIKIPKDPLNKQDEVVPVCLNGYNYFIKRGETVEVPQTVADVLTEAKYI